MMPTIHGQPRKICAQFGVNNLYEMLGNVEGLQLVFTGSKDLELAYDSELTVEEFQGIATGVAEMQTHAKHGHDYIARQAFLTSELLLLSKWTPAAREAVAYATLRIGMWSHGYHLKAHGSGFLVGNEPSKLLLLHKTYPALVRVLRKAYEPMPVALAA